MTVMSWQQHRQEFILEPQNLLKQTADPITADSDASIPLEVTAPVDRTLNHRFMSFALALLVGLWDVLRACGARF